MLANSQNGGQTNNIARSKLLKEFSKNEKDLKTELQQLELAKKQYESSCKHEIQKVIIRYTNRIAKHHFYLDSRRVNNNNNNNNESDTFKNINYVAYANDSRISTAASRRNSSAKTNISVETTPRIVSGFFKRTSPAKTIDDKLVVAIKERPIIMSPSLKSPTTGKSTTKTSKKSVSWNAASSFYNDDSSDQKRSPSSSSFSRRKSSDIKNGDFDASENINQFLDSLKTTNSGFYTYLNADGKSVCAGYDNFGNLNRFNSASTNLAAAAAPPIQQQRKVSIKKTIINHFEESFDLRNSRGKKLKNYNDNNEDFVKSSLLFSESMMFNKNMELAEDKDDKKIFDKVFRAQTTRNLTMKILFV
jgi:hypothetical protein